MPTIPSFIKDIDDLVRRIRGIIDLPSDVLLVTFGVMSLCSSIPNHLGLRALNDFLLDRNLPTNVVNGIHSMTELVLKLNVSEISTDNFLQTSDIAIGTEIICAV